MSLSSIMKISGCLDFQYFDDDYSHVVRGIKDITKSIFQKLVSCLVFLLVNFKNLKLSTLNATDCYACKLFV